MSTCNRLDFQTLGSQPIVPKNLPDHWGGPSQVSRALGSRKQGCSLLPCMPVDANGATWGALLDACRTYGNVELEEFAAKKLLKLEPNASN